MNQQKAKFLRKRSKLFNLPYKRVKQAFSRLSKGEQEQFLQKWLNHE